MAYYQVSDENLSKVECYFVKKVKETGSNRIEATVVDIADGAGVALATAHKAIKELESTKALEIIKPKSRRFAITYIYKKDIEGFEAKQSQEEQLEYLQEQVQQLQAELAAALATIKNYEGENKVLKNKLYQIAK